MSGEHNNRISAPAAARRPVYVVARARGLESVPVSTVYTPIITHLQDTPGLGLSFTL